MVLRQRAARKNRPEELQEREETQPPKRRKSRVSSTPADESSRKRSFRPQTSPSKKENPAPQEVIPPFTPFSIEDLLIEAANRKSNSASEQTPTTTRKQEAGQKLVSDGSEAALVSKVGAERVENTISLESFLKGTRRLDLFPPSGDPVAAPSAVKSESQCTEPAPPQKQDEAIEKMDTAIKSLSKLESEVMSALFPTDGSIPQSYELIASRFGMTVEEVKGIADNALRGLRGTRGPNGRISTAWN